MYMQEEDFQRMGGKDSAKMASWIRAKGEHKRMMTHLLQVRAHLILCFRAEQKIEMVREDGKLKIVPKQTLTSLDGWVPLTEKTVPFELTCSFLLTPDAPGIPKPIKLQEQHRGLFPLDVPITEASGRSVAEWAAGGQGWRQEHKKAMQSALTLPDLHTAFLEADKAARGRKDASARTEFAAQKDREKARIGGKDDDEQKQPAG
jgi:hypothetical protein